MRVVVSERLARAMRRKRRRAIVLDVAFCRSCGGAVGQLHARLAGEEEAARLLEGGARRIPCEEKSGEALVVADGPAELLVANPRIELDEVVRVDTGMLGAAELAVTGAR